MHLFFTHFHYDHVLGLPFFAPLYDPSIQLDIWSGHLSGVMSTKEMLHDLMRPPWFPIEISICRAAVVSRDFKSGDVIKPWPEVSRCVPAASTIPAAASATASSSAGARWRSSAIRSMSTA